MVKVSWFGGLTFNRITEPEETTDGILRVAGLPDLFATKLNTLYQRAEAKDYLDVYALLRAGLSLADGLWTLPRKSTDRISTRCCLCRSSATFKNPRCASCLRSSRVR